MGESSGLREPEKSGGGGGGEHLCYPRWEGSLKCGPHCGFRCRGRVFCFLCGPSQPAVATDGDPRHHRDGQSVSSLFVLHFSLSGGTLVWLQTSTAHG